MRGGGRNVVLIDCRIAMIENITKYAKSQHNTNLEYKRRIIDIGLVVPNNLSQLYRSVSEDRGLCNGNRYLKSCHFTENYMQSTTYFSFLCNNHVLRTELNYKLF